MFAIYHFFYLSLDLFFLNFSLFRFLLFFLSFSLSRSFLSFSLFFCLFPFTHFLFLYHSNSFSEYVDPSLTSAAIFIYHFFLFPSLTSFYHFFTFIASLSLTHFTYEMLPNIASFNHCLYLFNISGFMPFSRK